jgi:hypothetical protein
MGRDGRSRTSELLQHIACVAGDHAPIILTPSAYLVAPPVAVPGGRRLQADAGLAAAPQALHREQP